MRRHRQHVDRPVWPEQRRGPFRLLIEDGDGASSAGIEYALAPLACDVAVCRGPAETDCPLLTGESCDLVEGADLIVNKLDLRTPVGAGVLAAEQAAAPSVPVIVEIPRPEKSALAPVVKDCRVLAFPATSQAYRDAVIRALTDRLLAETNEPQS